MSLRLKAVLARLWKLSREQASQVRPHHCDLGASLRDTHAVPINRWDKSLKRWTILVVLAAVWFGCSTEGPPDVTSDLTPPSLEMVRPTDGTIVQGLTKLEVRVRDDVDLSRVEYWVDGIDRTSMTLNEETDLYEAVVDTRALEGRIHHITVDAFDGAGNNTRATVTVIVEQRDNPPSLRIISPAGEGLLQGVVMLQVQADDDHGFPVVEYAVDGASGRP